MEGSFFFLGTYVSIIAVAFGYVIGSANRRQCGCQQPPVAHQEEDPADFWKKGAQELDEDD